MILVAFLLLPLLGSGLIALLRKRGLIELVHVLATLATLGAGSIIILRIIRARRDIDATARVLTSMNGLLRVDELSALLIIVITVLAAVAALFAIGYIRAEIDETHFKRVRLFFALFHLFVFTMLLAVTTDNLGVMWVAVEGTSLATVFLVNLHNTKTSIEAAYKYLIISSVGIAFAFLGTVLIFYAGQHGKSGVNWSALHATAPTLNPEAVRLAFLFALIGYGTKAGLAPMHTWLPDAHSEAPAPISAMMSGVLLNVGFYALLRFKALSDITVGTTFASRLLIALGLLSLVVAAVSLLLQRNYKRMLAFSSIEHLGLATLGLGFGGYWGIFGALLHAVNHAFAKSSLFLLSGSIFLKYRTTETRGVRGLLRTAPATGIGFLVGTLALIGLPPFAPFISEFIIFRAGIAAGAIWPAAIGILLLAIVFAGMLRSLNQMLFGALPPELTRGDALRWSLAPLAVNFVMILGLGLTIPLVVTETLNQAINALGAG